MEVGWKQMLAEEKRSARLGENLITSTLSCLSSTLSEIQGLLLLPVIEGYQIEQVSNVTAFFPVQGGTRTSARRCWSASARRRKRPKRGARASLDPLLSSMIEILSMLDVPISPSHEAVT